MTSRLTFVDSSPGRNGEFFLKTHGRRVNEEVIKITVIRRIL